MTKFTSLIISLFVILNMLSSSEQNHRQRRYFLVPPQAPTRLQLVVGLGLPIDLVDQQVVTGYAFHMQGIIPYEIEHLYPDYFTFEDRRSIRYGGLVTPTNHSDETSKFTSVPKMDSFDKKRKIRYDNEIKYSRWRIYRVLEGILNHRGMQGKHCLLRSICEVSVLKITHESGLLGELVNIILTPSSSSEPTENDDHLEYYAAEQMGHSKMTQRCAEVYTLCDVSIIDQFSKILADVF